MPHCLINAETQHVLQVTLCSYNTCLLYASTYMSLHSGKQLATATSVQAVMAYKKRLSDATACVQAC